MFSIEDDYCLTFNGEIYNYIELRSELEDLGWSFRSSGDTEVLMAALALWGEEALPRLRGMYAFAFFNRRDGSAIFARDPFGKKPLFIARGDGAVYFSSEIEPLNVVRGERPKLNADALDSYLLNRYAEGPTTLFTSIDKLPPGGVAHWRAGLLSISKYYTPPISLELPSLDQFDDAVRRFRSIFDDAVRIRMRSDAPYGLFLSGGVDSAAILSVMVRHASRRVRTFTVGFHERAVSELETARRAAALFGAHHEECVLTPEEFVALWPEAVRRHGGPVSEASDIAMLMLAKKASESVKMVLTGEGADEVLAGYPKYVAELYSSFYQKIMPNFIHRQIVNSTADVLPYAMRRMKVLARALGERDLVKRLRFWFGGMTLDQRNALYPRDRRNTPTPEYSWAVKPSTNLRRAMYFDQISYLPDNTLERGDRMLMAHSIEGRMPFMDVDLVALAAKFSDRVLIRNGVRKAVLREAMRDQLPREFIDRKKIGFRVPVDTWFRSELVEVLRDLLCSDRTRIRKILNGDLIDRIVDDHIDGRSNEGRVLWTLANLEQFLRIYDVDLEVPRQSFLAP